MEHSNYVCQHVRWQIDILDENQRGDPETQGEGPEEDYEHVTMGSKQPSTTLGALMDSKKTDLAFDRFHTKLGDWLSRFLQDYNIPLPEDKWIRFLYGKRVRRAHPLWF